MGGAELLGHGQLVIADVDGDDRGRPGQQGPGDRVESDTAGADDRHRVPDAHLRGVDGSAGSGGDAAAQHRRLWEGDFLVHHGQLVLVHQGLFGKPTQTQGLGDVGAVFQGDAGRLIGLAQGRTRVGAGVGPSGQAVNTRPAELNQAGDHVVANVHGRHLGTDGLHDTRDLVSQHRREPQGGGRALLQVQVGGAQPRCLHGDKHFAADRVRELHLCGLEAFADTGGNRSLHGLTFRCILACAGRRTSFRPAASARWASLVPTSRPEASPPGGRRWSSGRRQCGR